MASKAAWAFAAFLLCAAAVPPAPVSAAPAAKAPSPAPADFSGVWLKATPGFRYSEDPPYLPDAKARFDSLRPQDDPGARCTYSSMPRIMISPYPLEIVQKPTHILVVSEFNGVIRRIWLNRGEHSDVMGPTYQGDSYGVWEGDTLVVRTAWLNGKNYLNPAGDLMSDAMTVVERWSIMKPQDGGQPKLKIDFTFTDPKVYTRPFSSTMIYDWRPELELMEMVCNDNNRNNPLEPGPMNFTSTSAPAPNYTAPAPAR